jgi:hypothetical protein
VGLLAYTRAVACLKGNGNIDRGFGRVVLVCQNTRQNSTEK